MRRIPPGRAGVLWLRRRLAVAERGTTLLRQKLTILAQQASRLREDRDATAHAWQTLDADARTWLTRAALLGGEPAVRPATGTAPLTVELRWTTVMGLRYPAEPIVHLPDQPADRPALGSAALVRAEALYRDAAVAAVRHAAAAAALAAVETETAATRQRLRALERRWIPRLTQALGAAELQIAELEAADAVRRRRAH
jgi:V/A-type H+-transporting ATPase subunit D